MKMETKMNDPVLEEGIAILFKKMGPVKAIEFFQKMGLNNGDSVKELESFSEKKSKEVVMEGIRRMRNAKIKNNGRTSSNKGRNIQNE